MMNHWFLIGFLSVSTYLSRVIGVEIMAGRKISPVLQLYFHYVPIGIISALIMKQLFIPTDGQLTISFPVLIGCIRDRGVKVANFQVLRDTKMPAVLVECGFMDDPRGIEQAWMLDKSFHKGVAEAICKAVQSQLKQSYKAPDKAASSNRDRLVRVQYKGEPVGAYADPDNALNKVKELTKVGSTIDIR